MTHSKLAWPLFAAVALAFAGCDADRIKDLETKADALGKDNDSLRGRVKDLEGQLSKTTLERDELKAAAAKPPDPVVPVPVVAATPAKATTKKHHKKH